MFNFSNDALAHHVSKMTTEINIIKGFEHNGEKGREAEGVLKNFLKEMLPKKVSIGTGFALNSEGKHTNQLDIMLYDGYNTPPIFQGYENTVISIDSIFATIETKLTYYNKPEIVATAQRSANNIKRMALKGLETEEHIEFMNTRDKKEKIKNKEYLSYSRYYPYLKSQLINQQEEKKLPLCILFAYSSNEKKLETVINYLNKKDSLCVDKKSMPYYPALDIICILDKGIIVRDHDEYISFFSKGFKPDSNRIFNTFYYLLNHHIDRKVLADKDYISTWFTSLLRSDYMK
ncbi:MAG: DUF6602 domain-containing protein [Bacillota bacterium]